MKNALVILMLLAFPAIMLGQEVNEIQIKKDIAETVFRSEFEQSPKSIMKFQRVAEEYKPTHFAISIENRTDLNLNPSFIPKLAGLTPYPIIDASEVTCNRYWRTGSYGQFGNCKIENSDGSIIYPIFFIITEIKLAKDNSAEVKIYVEPGTGDCSLETKYHVVLIDGKWLILKAKKRYVCGT